MKRDPESLCRFEAELKAEMRREDIDDRRGALIDSLAKDILSDIESGQGAYFNEWRDRFIRDCFDDPDALWDLLRLLYLPAKMIDKTGSSHEVAIERLARMRAALTDHQEAWAQQEAKQQMED